MSVVYLISVALHILAAAVWVGGAAFIALVMVPALRRPEHRPLGPALLGWAGRRFRTVGWACLAVLAATGTFNLWWRGYRWRDLVGGELWIGSFGRALAFKLGFVAALLLMTLYHDFVLGPKAARVLRENPGAPEAGRLRRSASWAGRAGLLVSLIVILFAVLLVRGWP